MRLLLTSVVLALAVGMLSANNNNQNNNNQPQHEEDGGASDAGRVADSQHAEPLVPLTERDPAGLFLGATDRASVEATLHDEQRALADDRALLLQNQQELAGLEGSLRSLVAQAASARQAGDAAAVARLASEFASRVREMADARRERRDLLDEVSSRSRAIEALLLSLGE